MAHNSSSTFKNKDNERNENIFENVNLNLEVRIHLQKQYLNQLFYLPSLELLEDEYSHI